MNPRPLRLPILLMPNLHTPPRIPHQLDAIIRLALHHHGPILATAVVALERRDPDAVALRPLRAPVDTHKGHAGGGDGDAVAVGGLGFEVGGGALAAFGGEGADGGGVGVAGGDAEGDVEGGGEGESAGAQKGEEGEGLEVHVVIWWVGFWWIEKVDGFYRFVELLWYLVERIG